MPQLQVTKSSLPDPFTHRSFKNLLNHLVDHVPDWRVLDWEHKKAAYDQVLSAYDGHIHRTHGGLYIEFAHEHNVLEFELSWS